MRLALLGLVLGILTIRFLPSLPPLLLCILLFCLGVVFLPWRLFPIGFYLIGVAWGCFGALYALNARLSPELDGKVVWIEGVVSGLPEQSGKIVRFHLKKAKAKNIQLPSHIRLSWYNGQQPVTGEYWRLKVRLKYPRGTVNDHSFDYEQWLTAKHIGATGTVRQGERLQESSGISNWRYRLRQRMESINTAEQNGGLVALVLGDGSALTRAQWQVLQETGTVHLMIISGQHITLLAGGIYFLVVLLVRLGVWPRSLPWLPFACALAMSGALLYGFLAGFDVPVRRACIMLALVLLWRLRFRYLGVVFPFLLTLAIVLIIDPLASLQAGFWLSFTAVAILLLIFSGRLSRDNWWLNAIKIELAITIGLLPLFIALLLPVSITGPIANLIAVPLISFIIVPLALLGSLLIAIPYIGGALLWLAGFVLKVLFIVLAFIADTVPSWVPIAPSWWELLLIFLGVFLILLPRGLFVRLFGFVFCLPLIFTSREVIQENKANVIVFDVGQGTSVLVKTKKHALLYDTGPSFGDFNLGERIVLPELQRRGERALDKVIVSHADTDHSGGLQPIVRRLAIKQLVSGEPSKLVSSQVVEECQHQAWEWDGVKFSVWQWGNAKTGNDRSCVLLVEASGERLLLTGDISSRAERAWIKDYPIKIHWLLAPHHGSKNSSSNTLLAMVQPDNVLISRGWLNPFNHPSGEVLVRYNIINTNIYDTAVDGALQVSLGEYLSAKKARDTKYFWRKQ